MAVLRAAAQEASVEKSLDAARRSACATGAVVLALMLVGCSSKQAATPEPVVSVQTATVQRKTIERVIASNALLYPINQATIVPKISA
ncbi:MAG: hypothetical protein ACRD45_20255, partial [Bryobacteraceae bacterium]